MDLTYNRSPAFTGFVLERGLLAEPFVLIDVGVQGGISPRWRHLGGRLETYGFDALEEAVAPLRKAAGPNEHYFALALGNDDGEREFFVAPESTASSFYAHSSSRHSVDPRVSTSSERRHVTVKRLDSLLAEGAIAPADFIKIDCEGFEPEILKGASALIKSGVLGLEVETNFNTSPVLPQTHFWAVYEQLLPHGFLVYDLAFNRVPRAAFAERARAIGIPVPATNPRPATFNVLFYRERATASLDELIKRAVILELHGLNDVAYDLILTESGRFAGGAAVAEAADLLISLAHPHSPNVRQAATHLARALQSSIAHRLRRTPWR